jgi:hypothetical protein
VSTTTAPVGGCYSCAVLCATDPGSSGGASAERQAIGASQTGYDSACRLAVRSLEGWAHGSQGKRLGYCRVMDPSSRVAAAPSVKTSARRFR